MTEKFTKEPWEISDMSGVDAMDNYTVCFHIGVSSTGEMIADCQSDKLADYERVRANAHLIAAAPEMYEMLAINRKMFEDLADVLPNEQAKDLVHDMASDIESVLGKARGEE